MSRLRILFIANPNFNPNCHSSKICGTILYI